MTTVAVAVDADTAATNYSAGVRVQLAQKHSQKRCLSASVAAADSDSGVFVHLQTHAGEYLDLAEKQLQFLR